MREIQFAPMFFDKDFHQRVCRAVISFDLQKEKLHRNAWYCSPLMLTLTYI